MKKSALISGIILIFIGLAFTPLGKRIYSNFEDTKTREGSLAQLKFTSRKGNYTLLIDNTEIGKVEEGKTLEFTQIKSGNRKIKIKRESSVPDFYFTLERDIEFLPVSIVEIEWEAGPTLESSNGIIKYFQEINKPNGSELFILPFPNNSSIELDSKKTNSNTLEILDTVTHDLKVSNNETFVPENIKVNLTDTSTKKVFTNLKLIIEVYLYKQPFK